MKTRKYPRKVQNQEGTEQRSLKNMHRKYRKLVSAGLVLTMAGAMTLQGCGQKEEDRERQK